VLAGKGVTAWQRTLASLAVPRMPAASSSSADGKRSGGPPALRIVLCHAGVSSRTV